MKMEVEGALGFHLTAWTFLVSPLIRHLSEYDEFGEYCTVLAGFVQMPAGFSFASKGTSKFGVLEMDDIDRVVLSQTDGLAEKIRQIQSDICLSFDLIKQFADQAGNPKCGFGTKFLL